MELKRFQNLFSQKVSDRIFNILWRLQLRRGKRGQEGWALYKLWGGCTLLERNLNKLEERVAQLELDGVETGGD